MNSISMWNKKKVMIRLGDDNTVGSLGCGIITMHHHGHIYDIKVYVLANCPYQMVLGIPWLEKMNPSINWRT